MAKPNLKDLWNELNQKEETRDLVIDVMRKKYNMSDTDIANLLHANFEAEKANTTYWVELENQQPWYIKLRRGLKIK